MGLRASEFSYKSLWRRKLLQSLRLQAEVVYMEQILHHYGFVPHTEMHEIGEPVDVWERPV